MALIGQIRKNSWLLVLAIGLALAAFIIMDMSSGDKSLFGSGRTNAGSIDGQKIDWNEFNRAQGVLYGNSGGDVFAQRASLWNYFVEDVVVKKEAGNMGLGVSREELIDLQFSQDNRKLSPLIIQRFSDPNTRQLNRQQLTGIQQAIESGDLNPEFRMGWSYQEKEIVKNRLQSKMEDLITKAVYTPNWMAEMMYANDEQKVNFDYVKIPFDEIDDSAISLTDADFTQYINENKSLYKQDEEVRKVDYVVFDVKATAEDEAAIRGELQTIANEFITADNDTIFVENNYGTISSTYEKAASFSSIYSDTIFSAPIGAVVGPYQDGNAFTVVKVLDRMVVPDSVRARHILIQARTQPEYIAASQTIDSLQNLIEAGTHRFDSLAVKFSQGPSNVKGGDLGFAGPGAMVKPFNDLIFYEAKQGKVYPVLTQFGVHLVEVTDKKFINNETGAKIATINQNIVPSETTISAVNNKVMEFIASNRSLDQLAAAADANPELTLETSPPVKRTDYFVGTLGGGQTSRDIIKWAFENASVGEVSSQIYTYADEVDFYDNKFVVAGLRAVQDAGLPSVDFVRNDITPLVKNYKKGQMLAEQIKGKDLSAAAGTFSDVTVETASDVTFSSSSVPGLGSEPKVLASAFALGTNQVSTPIVGNSGVFIIKPTNKTTVGAASNLPEVRRKTNTNMRNQVRGQLVQALKENADIKDNRSKFY